MTETTRTADNHDAAGAPYIHAAILDVYLADGSRPVLHVARDEHGRLYTEVRADQTEETMGAFATRAVAWFQSNPLPDRT